MWNLVAASNESRSTDAEYSQIAYHLDLWRVFDGEESAVTLEKRLSDGAAYGREDSVKPSLLNSSREAVSFLGSTLKSSLRVLRQKTTAAGELVKILWEKCHNGPRGLAIRKFFFMFPHKTQVPQHVLMFICITLILPPLKMCSARPPLYIVFL